MTGKVKVMASVCRGPIISKTAGHRCLGGVVVRALNFQSSGRGFDSRPGRRA